VMLVNFFAPWCHWCQRLEPVWEKSAAAIGQKHPGVDIMLAKVGMIGSRTLALICERERESVCVCVYASGLVFCEVPRSVANTRVL
jgi:thiol-disulfide isomerase/thioredoxin